MTPSEPPFAVPSQKDTKGKATKEKTVLSKLANGFAFRMENRIEEEGYNASGKCSRGNGERRRVLLPTISLSSYSLSYTKRPVRCWLLTSSDKHTAYTQTHALSLSLSFPLFGSDLSLVWLKQLLRQQFDNHSLSKIRHVGLPKVKLEILRHIIDELTDKYTTVIPVRLLRGNILWNVMGPLREIGSGLPFVLSFV